MPKTKAQKWHAYHDGPMEKVITDMGSQGDNLVSVIPITTRTLTPNTCGEKICSVEEAILVFQYE